MGMDKATAIREYTGQTKSGWIPLSLTIHPEINAAMLRICREDKISRSEFVRSLIHEELLEMGLAPIYE